VKEQKESVEEIYSSGTVEVNGSRFGGSDSAKRDLTIGGPLI
jgi:hypothetical protein